MEKITDKLHIGDGSSSSDSDADKRPRPSAPPADHRLLRRLRGGRAKAKVFRLLGDEQPIHKVLGGGKFFTYCQPLKSLLSAPEPDNPPAVDASAAWSLYDDLYLDAAYDFSSEAQIPAAEEPTRRPPPRAAWLLVTGGCNRWLSRRWLGPVGAHLASGSWTLSREQGNKLLVSRFRGDRLYICDWPGCMHAEECRKYMVFRGVFHNFARFQMRRALRTIAVECAFCGCTEAWDLYSAFCLHSFYGYHDEGEPVVRAYVCENGHVAGAWTERPLYS